MKKCNGCGKSKPESEFSSRVVGGRRYLRTQCRECESHKRLGRAYSTGAIKRAQLRYSKKLSRMRANNEFTPRWILSDSRRSDKKNGRHNDLDVEFIERAISLGCSYCGETTIRMTLDRIDNTKGHTKENVVPSCIRCNYARRNMPYGAWLFVPKGMREAREKGLFGDWTGRTR